MDTLIAERRAERTASESVKASPDTDFEEQPTKRLSKAKMH